jgi:hypothetical protein
VVEYDLGHPAISTDGWHVSIGPEVESLTKDELLAIILRQANALRILQNQASQRASLLEDLRRQLAESRD